MNGRTLTAALCAMLGGHASAQDLSLQTTIAGGGSAAGIMFDLTCLDPAGIFLSRFAVHCPGAVPQSWVTVWTRPDSYIGHESSRDGWVLTAEGYFQCGTQEFPTAFTLINRRLELGQTLAVYIDAWTPAAMVYTPIPPASPVYETSHLRISGGAAKSGRDFSGSTTPNAMWNGRVTYSLTDITCYPNCDHSTTSPFLTANDFQCFLNHYASLNSDANCDRSTAAPLLNANDFQCFLNAYAAGCTAP